MSIAEFCGEDRVGDRLVLKAEARGEDNAARGTLSRMSRHPREQVGAGEGSRNRRDGGIFAGPPGGSGFGKIEIVKHGRGLWNAKLDLR